MSRNTALICILALFAVLWTPLASARPVATMDGEVAVPDVVGLIYIEATDELQGAGFNPERLIGNLTIARITDQCPRGGTLATPGSFVALRIAGSIDCGAPASGSGGGSGGGGSGGDGSGGGGSIVPLAVPKLVPLIFVPGIMGTEIVDNQLFFPDTKLWPQAAYPGLGGLFSDLALDDSLHDQSNVNIAIRGPVLDTIAGREYSSTVNVLEHVGYQQGDGTDATLFMFGYDWRRSVADNGSDSATQQRLAKEIQDVMAQTHRSRVDILAHSQGGLVTMAFLATHPDLAQHVRRVVTIATPILGAAKAIGIAKWATPCEFNAPKIFDFLIDCAVDMHKVRAAVHNMPGVYELFPTPKYAGAVGTSPITSPEGLQLSYGQWTQILQAENDALSPALLNEAAGVHASLFANFDPAGAPYKMLRIVGDGPVRTPIAFREVPQTVCKNLSAFCRLTTHGREKDSFAGDGTVPQGSASLIRCSTENGGVCFDERPRSIPNYYADSLTHMQLAQDPKSLCVAVHFFGGACRPEAFAETLDGSPPPDIDGNDIANQDPPPTPKAVEVNVTGSGDVSAVDITGDAVPVGTFLDEQLVGFAQPGTYTVTIHATDSYPLQVQIERIGDAVEQQTTFYLPAPQPGQTYTLPFTSDADLSGVQLVGPAGAIAPTGTTNGDTSSDGTPPTTIAGGTITRAGTSSVQLLAHDDGSGVGSSYVVKAENTPAVLYDAPFTVPLYSTVYFQSVDKQGNAEAPQSIVADDAPGYRDLAAPVIVRDELSLRRTIFPQGDEDWFRFDANGTTDYRAELDGDHDRYQLDLVNADGTVVKTTHRWRKENDDIRGVLPVGTYYLHVYCAGGAADRRHAYTLDLEAHDRGREHEHGR